MRMIATARRAITRLSAPSAAAVRVLLRLSLLALIVFHLGLLGAHLLDGRAFEPATAVRWVLSLVVLAGFRSLSRRGVPLLLGRRAVGLWLLVVIIHCSAAWDGGAAAALDRAIPKSVTALAQVSLTVLAVGAAVAAAFTTAARAWGGSHRPFFVPTLIAGLPASGFVFRFSPRPPPLA